jgi:hypothetical protein
VAIGDFADNGPRWQQLLSVLPLLGHLPIGAIIIKLGPRQIKLSKQTARKLQELSGDQRKALMSQAASARTDDEAAAIIKRSVDVRHAASSGSGTVAGDAKNTVYRSVTGREVNYVGITNNLARRAAAQLRKRGLQIEEIRRTGKFPIDVRWHHDPTVANRPDLAADPSVVRPVRGGTKGHLEAHGGDFRKP